MFKCLNSVSFFEQNLEKLLAVPTGCGEQIIATLAPNLYVLRYLTAANLVTSKVYQRIVKNLKIGMLCHILI